MSVHMIVGFTHPTKMVPSVSLAKAQQHGLSFFGYERVDQDQVLELFQIAEMDKAGVRDFRTAEDQGLDAGKFLNRSAKKASSASPAFSLKETRAVCWRPVASGAVAIASMTAGWCRNE